MPTRFDLTVIGAGPAGCAVAIRAARGGARVAVFEKAGPGRDKVCGDALTPRAVTALGELDIRLDEVHRIDGLRMIAGDVRRELPWPQHPRFGCHGAVWPRRLLDKHLTEAVEAAGAEVVWNTEALPIFSDDGAVVGVEAGGRRFRSDLVALSAGAPGRAARMLGAERAVDEPFGLAIRTYAPTPRHDDGYLEACLTLRDGEGTWIPGYGWIFPAGDGTVNIGVGSLSTMKRFRSLNLKRLLDVYRRLVVDEWELGDYLSRPRAWRLPMSSTCRHGTGWAAVGDAAGLINPMNGEGIDYALESGVLLAEQFLKDPDTAPAAYDRAIGERFDGFLRTGRRFSFLIGHPWILRNGLRLAVATQVISEVTLQVMGNLIDNDTPGAAGMVLKTADRGLACADSLLRRTRASS